MERVSYFSEYSFGAFNLSGRSAEADEARASSLFNPFGGLTPVGDACFANCATVSSAAVHTKAANGRNRVRRGRQVRRRRSSMLALPRVDTVQHECVTSRARGAPSASTPPLYLTQSICIRRPAPVALFIFAAVVCGVVVLNKHRCWLFCAVVENDASAEDCEVDRALRSARHGCGARAGCPSA